MGMYGGGPYVCDGIAPMLQGLLAWWRWASQTPVVALTPWVKVTDHISPGNGQIKVAIHLQSITQNQMYHIIISLLVFVLFLNNSNN